MLLATPHFLAFFSTVLAIFTGAVAAPAASYIDWKKFKGNGVNLGGWLAQEAVIDPTFWSQNCVNTTDEWTCCIKLGSRCGPVLERRYATFITVRDIDRLAAGGVNVLRIPTTYAAWVKVPGSAFYSGNQISFLQSIATYAITKYNMHVIVDIHSLPGGVNVETAARFIQTSGFPQSFTLEPINEPVDNIAAFGFPEALSESGAAWTLNYIQGAISRVLTVNAKIPIMFQGSFRPETYWSPKFLASTNLVFDVHNYYFAGRPTDSDNVTAVICSDAKASAGDGKFPVFVGEWSIQTLSNNKFANREKNLKAGLYAFGKYDQGSAYWTARFLGNEPVNGEGVQGDYWNYQTFIDLNYVNLTDGAKYCS